MKKILSILCLFILISCSPETDEVKVNYELVPIQSVVIPDLLYVGIPNNIQINYSRPSSCHGFDKFYFEKNDFTRTIAIQNYVVEKDDCQTLTNDIRQETLKFNPNETGIYTFKFWQGKDGNGNDIFLEINREAVVD